MLTDLKEAPTANAGGLKRTCIHLGDQDRAAIAILRNEFDLPSDALTIRQALRFLAKRLNNPRVLADDAKVGKE